MKIEYIGVKIFFDEAAAAGEVWVAEGLYKNVYAQEVENYSYSLPAWSKRERVDEYLAVTRLREKFAPQAIPLATFADSWLSNQSMGISEVQINPDGNATRVLALTNEEFQAEASPS